MTTLTLTTAELRILSWVLREFYFPDMDEEDDDAVAALMDKVFEAAQ